MEAYEVKQYNLNTEQGRRSRMETFGDILKTIAAGTEKPTHIMYKANLSWKILQQYLRLLEAQGLVVPSGDDGRRVYHLSEKGFKLLSQFNSVRDDLLLHN